MKIALNFWKKKYGKVWNLRISQHLLEREGAILEKDSIYLSHKFRIEEYSILDFLLRNLSEQKEKIRIVDVSCGSGLVPFFIYMNRKRYSKIEYIGIDSSESQLFIAKLRNPWTFVQFTPGNLYDTGLNDNYGDLALNWQTINHVGKIKEAIDELIRISGNWVYIINYVYYTKEDWIKKYSPKIYEKEYAKLCWSFNKDEIKQYIANKQCYQLWKKIEDQKFGSNFPTDTTSEQTLISKDKPIKFEWVDLSDDWKVNISEN
ncbi:hypothetical protein ES702_00069 [subsurface metagenome]